MRVTHLVLIASLACRPAPINSVDPCAAPSIDTGDWNTIDERDFSFDLPPAFRRDSVQGIDSNVGRFTADDGRVVVGFDFGRYSSDLAEDSARHRSYSRCSDVIGGRAATVITAIADQEQGTWHMAAATWRNIDGTENHLTISATARDSARVPELLAIVRSVQFADNR